MSGINTSRHHADWLSLVEVSGPFVSLPVLLRVFQHGLDPRDPSQAKVVRIADTLSLEWLEVSEAYSDSSRQNPQMEILSAPEQIRLDTNENLLPFVVHLKTNQSPPLSHRCRDISGCD